MRRCTIKLITGIGTDGEETKSARQPAPSKRNVTCNDCSMHAWKAELGAGL